MYEWYRNDTREKLLKLLNTHRDLFSQSIFDYLNSLIELEFSVVREYINSNDRETLSKIEIYNEIATYNIYFRALDIFKQNAHDLNIRYSDSSSLERLLICNSFDSFFDDIKLFDFNHENKQVDSDLNISSDDKEIKIGTISLYQLVENKELKEAELYWISQKMDDLRRWQLYGSLCKSEEKEIDELQHRLWKMDKIKNIVKEMIEVSNRIHNLLLEDYGLTDQDFMEESKTYQPNSGYQKIFIKKQQNLIITNHVQFI